MANIYVPNIIITQDYNLINKIMESDYLDTTQNFEESKAILLSTRQNKYVYSLEHSINFQGTDSKIILKILDTDNNFENNFFNESFFEMMMNEQVTNFIKSNDKISEFGNYFSKALNSQIRIYIAYGIGNELANWSNPIACTLFGANIDLANNGIKTYTYEFYPEVNYFFKYQTIDADPNNITENLNITFGEGLARTKVDYVVNKSEYKKVTKNISNILKKYAAKVTNTSESNVICLIPDIDDFVKNPIVSSIPVPEIKDMGDVVGTVLEGVYEAGKYYLTGETSNFVTTAIVDWNNDFSVIEFYRQYFKNIEGNKNNAVNCTTIVLKNKFKFTRLKEDVLSEINSKLAKAKSTASQSSLEDQELINKLEDELTQLNNEKNELEESLRFWSGGSKSERKKQRLEKVKSQIDEKTSKLSEARENKASVDNIYKKKVSRLQTEVAVAGAVAEGINSILSGPDKPIGTFSKDKLAPDQLINTITLSMVATPDPSISKDSNKPSIPDWYKAIQNVFTGIASLYNKGNSYVVPHISYESDAKFLKLFHKYGLISDPTIPCVIVGERQMVLDYIYKNQIPINKILDLKSKFSINKEDKLFKILNDQQYAIDLKNIIMKKKNSSSFSEKIILDELAYGVKLTDILNEYTESEDIPIFLNNFKNSNILSYSLKNTENYMTATRSGVFQNRIKTLFSQLSDDKLQTILNRSGLIIKDGITPIELARTLFRDSVGLLTERDLQLQDQVSNEVRTAFNLQLQLDKLSIELAGFGMDKAMGIYKDSEVEQNLKNKYSSLREKYDQSIKGLSGKEKRIYDLLDQNKDSNLKNIIFSNSQENITVLNALLQFEILGKHKSIPKQDVMPLADLIILMNASKVDSGISQVEILPGLYLPNQNFILGKITEYAMRYFIEISIKTLPFFYLSNYRVISQPALLYSKKVNISNYNNDKIFDFFSGDYRIFGFKHVITTKECYSEFILSKANALGSELKKLDKQS